MKKSLYRNFLKEIILGVATLLLFGIILKFDINIERIIEGLRNFWLDYFFSGIIWISRMPVVLLFLILIFLWKKSKRELIIPIGCSILLGSIISFLMKIIIRRPRPFQEGIIPALNTAFYFIKDNFNTWNFSFPSGDAVLVFCLLPIIWKEFKELRYIWLIFAILVGFSRIYSGVHYMSDVFAGALIGYLTGLLIIKIEEKYKIGEKLID